MSNLSRGHRIRSTACGFGAAQDGNIAVIFALALLPILAFIGAAVDYSRASTARTSMQAALDSTVLMVSRDLSQGTITASQVNSKAAAYFTALNNNQEMSGISITASYTPGTASAGSTIVVNGSGSVATQFMGVAGVPRMNFNASSTSSWGQNLLRVALVLDTTGSMADNNKIGSLQTAAKNLVSQLSALAKNNGEVMISVVPFEADVNVGTANVNASWLRWDQWDPSNYQNSSRPYDTWCNRGNWLTMAQCLGHGNSWNHNVGNPRHSLWNGCVTDRDQSYDTDATRPTGQSTYFLADQDQTCPDAAIQPLTYNWSSVNSTINAMSPSGGTNQTVGLHWGWLSLLQQDPLNAPAEATGVGYQHIIILFTDGLNTGDRWYGDFSSQSSQVDARMKTLCDNINASGTTIYTVQIDTDGAGQSAVLPYCASEESNFFMLTQPSQIATAFSQIGTQIAKLRVAR